MSVLRQWIFGKEVKFIIKKGGVVYHGNSHAKMIMLLCHKCVQGQGFGVYNRVECDGRSILVLKGCAGHVFVVYAQM